jgi:4-amino-4-deoxy-L-arabinose transferase-like glycosyltransferase
LHSRLSKSLLDAGNQPLYLSLPSLGASGVFAFFFLLTVFHFWLAGYLPPAEDELYYWCWAQNLQPSYFDHPPMVAYFIRFSTALFGNSLIAIRLPAILSSLFVFVSFLLLAPRGNLVIAALLCPLTFFGCILITPDIPLVFFWVLYFVWFAWINRDLDSWNSDPITRVYRNWPVSPLQWILGGVLLGFGGLSKYTMLIAVPCGLVALFTRTRLRAWVPGYLVHLAVAGLLVLPVFVHNWKLGFAPLLFQWNHSMSGAGFSLSQGFRYLIGQVLLIGGLPFLLFPWIVLRQKDLCADPKSQAYFWFFVIPFVFFSYKSIRGPLEANWSIVAYLSFWPVADRLLSWSSFKGPLRLLVTLAFLTPWIASVLVLVHFVAPMRFIQPRYDRIAVLREQFSTAHLVKADLLNENPSTAFWVPNYQWAAYFRYLGIRAEQIPGASRPSQFTQSPQDPCTETTLYALDTTREPSLALSCFPKREVLKTYWLKVRGTEVSVVWLSRYSK